VPLRGGLGLTADQWLRTAEDHDRGGWRTVLAGYLYALDSEDGELIAFHWHPGRSSSHEEPHLHVRGLTKAHVPTGGAVQLGQVLRFAIADLAVEPIRSDWERVLDQHEMEDLNLDLGLQGPLHSAEDEPGGS
jgi:hypothetical protein